ncbi:hypothetical protein KC19_4G076200 [Ceratodon purpureus]|uniref:Uncharacterized protein n=1 Tax=Ceratodon purpureus TaxID=3225 RepID=A0A8T0I840_CERPU|nr:hypothetical protein KC19_4G076200 [Ceratodon purpureus]
MLQDCFPAAMLSAFSCLQVRGVRTRHAWEGDDFRLREDDALVRCSDVQVASGCVDDQHLVWAAIEVECSLWALVTKRLCLKFRSDVSWWCNCRCGCHAEEGVPWRKEHFGRFSEMAVLFYVTTFTQLTVTQLDRKPG